MIEKSIAVLPFLNISTEPDNEYFSDGITEEIINALTKIAGLNVTARTSSFVFKNKSLDIRSIGNKLGVATILEGSVRKAKNRVRITAQLVKIDGGFHLWSKKFDRELEDIFELQDEISLLIADQIRENFGHLEMGDQLVSSPEINIKAYELYLKGKHYIHKFNKNDILKGIEILEEVTKLQPNFALAYANIHYGYNMLAAAGMLPAEDTLEKGMVYLNKAIKLDDKLPECHHSLGWHSLNRHWDFVSAANHLNTALEIRPGYADAHQKMFITHALEGKMEVAYKHICMAIKLDPLSVLNNYFLGYYFYLQGEYDEANTYLKKCFELEPHFLFSYLIYALSLITQGKASFLLEEEDKLQSNNTGTLGPLIMKVLAYSSLKKTLIANENLKQLQKKLDGEQKGFIQFLLIHMYTIMEEYDKALGLIDDGVLNQEPLMTLLKEDPLLTPLHRFKRYQKAMHKIYALSDHTVLQKVEKEGQSETDAEYARYQSQLEKLVSEKQLYLDSNLSLRSLSNHLNIHPNKLSWLLNEYFNKNFNEYINTFRIEAFKNKALNPDNNKITLLGLAYESGFNSKTVFNTFFKRSVGLSPREWLKSVE